MDQVISWISRFLDLKLMGSFDGHAGKTKVAPADANLWSCSLPSAKAWLCAIMMETMS